MTTYSRISSPPYTYRLEKPEWKKGEKIDNFTFPYNFYGDAYTMFSRFCLWHSSLGLMTPGINWYTNEEFINEDLENRSIIRVLGNNAIYTPSPVLVGDFVNGNPVTMADNARFEQSEVFMVRFNLGVMPGVQVIENDHDVEYKSEMLDNIVKLGETIKIGVSDMLTDYHEKVIKSILTTFSFPIPPLAVALNPLGVLVTAPFVIKMKRINMIFGESAFQTIKNNFNSVVDEAIEKTEESLWQ